MKRAAVAVTGVVALLLVAVGLQYGDVSSLAAASTEEGQTEAAEEIEETADDSGIDTSVPILSGARIAVVSKGTKGEFWNTVRKGMEAGIDAVNTAYEYGKDEQITLTFEGPGDELEVEEQINTLDAVIAENPDVLCLSVGDMDSCQAQLEAAAENEIPVIAFDSNVSNPELIKAFRGTDNKLVGQIAAEKLESAIGGSGKAAVFSVQEKTESVRDRVQGFLDNLSPEIEVVEILYADQVEDMETAMQEVLTDYPDLDGVFCTNADIAELYLGLDQDEEHSVCMIGVDATSRQVKAVQDGEEIGMVSQNPYKMGYDTVMAAVKATAVPEANVEIEESVLEEPVWIGASELEDEQYADYIYN